MSDHATYLNPVYSRLCPDPYVLKHLNEYWCYYTGFASDGRCFGVLSSRDLVNWREWGGVMERYDPQATCWWAPEVIYDNGIFLMYYSVGNEVNMQIRVAEARHPTGPFKDCGVGLTKEEFAIDAHVFEDEDGTRWLFYATDFLTHTHIGTGTVYDRMIDPYRLAGEARPVTRAKYDWQIYDPNRIEKGGVRWHTVEGPFVIKRKGIYYQMFSGGNWQNETYGASFAASETIVRADEWDQFADGNKVLPILRTIPGKVIGPGHNSVVRGPDNQQMYCIYHEWSESAKDRVLAIDRLDWAGKRMFVMGPSFTPQFAPLQASFSDYFDENIKSGLGPNWTCSAGQWSVRDRMAIQEQATGEATATYQTRLPYFIAEVGLMLIDQQDSGTAGIKLYNENKPLLSFALKPQGNQAIIDVEREDGLPQAILLSNNFDFTAFHWLRIVVNHHHVMIAIDGISNKWEGTIEGEADSLALYTNNAKAAFAGFALTHGWEDLFTENTELQTLGWQTQHADRWQLRDGELWHVDNNHEHSALVKGEVPNEYELVINARLDRRSGNDGYYGFIPVMSEKELLNDVLLTIKPHEAGWALYYHEQGIEQAVSLTPTFDPFEYQQFRFWFRQGRLQIFHEAQLLTEVAVTGSAHRIGIYVSRAVAAFEMVRLTGMESGR